MPSNRSYFFLAIITFSLLLLASVDAKSRSQQGRRRHVQESDAYELPRRATKGGGSLAPAVPPLLPTQIPFSTKSPSRSSSSAPTVPKATDPSPSPVPDTTKTPTMVSSPTMPPSTTPPSPVAGSTTANSPAPSANTGLVTPTEVEEEQSRTRALLPFSLDITNQPPVDNVRLGMQDYLYERLTESFSQLESILLTVTNNDAQRRKLSMVQTLQQEQQQEPERQVQQETTTETFNFTGVAMFLPSETLPTEVEVQRAQLKALEDFHRLNQFLATAGGYDWQIEIIQLDGMVINQDGMKVGDSGTVDNEGDTMVQESYQAQGGSDNNSTVAISVSVTMVVLVGILVGFFVHRRRSKNTEDEPKETYQELIRTVEDLPKDLEPSPDKTLNVSFESVTVANTTYDSVQLPLADYGPSSPAGSNMDWNRVFALSQTPVEQTAGEVFEAKKLTPPKYTKIHELVTLAPVTETAKDGDDVTRDGEDSYGYDTLPEGHQDDFAVSSPVSPPLEVQEGDDDEVYDYVRTGNHYNQDRDLTIDLADFNIDPEDDSK